MLGGFLKSKQTKYTTYAAFYTLIVIAVLAGINWLANRHNKSLDTTANKRYSLSDQTEKVVRGLKEPVKLLYFDELLKFQQAKDLLSRYANLSNKLTVDYVDPLKKPQLAKAYGVRTMGTIVLERGEKRQEARSLSEEEVTSALVRVLKDSEKVVCFTAGSGEHAIDESTNISYSSAKEQLEKNNYRTQAVNLLEKPEIPQACMVLIVGGPRNDFPQPAVDALKSYVEDGGRTLFLLDPPIQGSKERVAPNDALLGVLAGWGVTASKDLVFEASGIGALYGLGPEVSLVNQFGTHPIVREMKGSTAALPLARSIDAAPKDKTSVEKIASTTKNSIATTQLTNLKQESEVKGEAKSYGVAAAGTYRSDKKSAAGTPLEGRFVVAGSSEWVANYVFRFSGNRDLFLNMINWLSSDEDLISIRPKDPADQRLSLTRGQMQVLRSTSQFLIPLLAIGLGVMVWWRRR
jgi:ABC-type uncharacterized transport system involved in gliding motility auxiliary subunit